MNSEKSTNTRRRSSLNAEAESFKSQYPAGDAGASTVASAGAPVTGYSATETSAAPTAEVLWGVSVYESVDPKDLGYKGKKFMGYDVYHEITTQTNEAEKK
ncbi:uncharacterized protein L203_104074 [Cryptococcus depauperatus CBS 7841]|uniref:Uncharacterized protein n=1 Tax=Cryptococcus depauperatus CBS 7841 TaxID=1295531 RepID=A0A1E3IBK2_9TREE|nr:hypothetical protein L203_04477 [Cryptococcus depauperatus CBS 7841]